MMRLVRGLLGRRREQGSEPHAEPRPAHPCARCVNCGVRYTDHPGARPGTPIALDDQEHPP